jgi:hypothetical protein
MAMPSYDVVHIKEEFRSALAAVWSFMWVLRSISISKSLKGG